MKVTRTHIENDDDMTQEQFDEWVGANVSYEFDFGAIKIRAISYDELPKRIDIGWYEKNGTRTILNNSLIMESEFLQVSQYLKEIGIYEEYRFFNGAYPKIPSSVWDALKST